MSEDKADSWDVRQTLEQMAKDKFQCILDGLPTENNKASIELIKLIQDIESALAKSK